MESKTAANLTQNISNADGTTAQAGDTIVYTLYAQNTGKNVDQGFVFQENLSDVLDYADVTNFGGGTMNSLDYVTWPAIDIQPGTTADVQITVKVKNPIPATPADPGDPMHYDMIMTNSYGNTINIKLPATPPQIIQNTASTLPNTGPGTGLFISAAIMVFAGYFFARSRLLATEAALVLHDSNQGGL